MNIFQRARVPLSLDIYKKADQNVTHLYCTVDAPDDQYILRMMVQSPECGLRVPEELMWLKDAIDLFSCIQRLYFAEPAYIYVTVRCGIVKSVTDDEWHVDGFSMRKPHVPEQNYIWSDRYPTEILNQKFDIPADFDPTKHNLHTYFQEHADLDNLTEARADRVILIDPYIVHRRPKLPVGTRRKMFRISFIPVEIEDDTCMQNPLMPVKIYGRSDVRNTLVPYKG